MYYYFKQNLVAIFTSILINTIVALKIMRKMNKMNYILQHICTIMTSNEQFYGRLSRVNVDLFAGTCNGTSTKPEPYKVVLGLSLGVKFYFRTALALLLPSATTALAPALALVGARDGTSFGNWHNRILG